MAAPATASSTTTLCSWRSDMTVTESTPTLKDGRVVAIAGPVVDVEFPPDAVPAINTALSFEIVIAGPPQEVRAAVAPQIGHSTVRAIRLRPTDRLLRGTNVRPDTRAGRKEDDRT